MGAFFDVSLTNQLRNINSLRAWDVLRHPNRGYSLSAVIRQINGDPFIVTYLKEGARQEVIDFVKAFEEKHLKVENLKRQWDVDPCWDIEQTEGFELFEEELLLYRLETEFRIAEKRKERLKRKAEELKCSVELVEYLEKRESRLSQLEDQVEKMEDKL